MASARGDAPYGPLTGPTRTTLAAALISLEAGEHHDAALQLHAWFAPEELEALASLIIDVLRNGEPVPALDSIGAEAELWASGASMDELAAYAWHAARRLPLDRRAGMVAALMRTAEAA